MDSSKSRTLHSELKLRNCLGPTFGPPTLEKKLLCRESTKGKEKKNINIQLPQQSEDNDNFSGKPFGKKLKVFKPVTPLNTNHALLTIFESFIS